MWPYQRLPLSEEKLKPYWSKFTKKFHNRQTNMIKRNESNFNKKKNVKMLSKLKEKSKV